MMSNWKAVNNGQHGAKNDEAIVGAFELFEETEEIYHGVSMRSPQPTCH